MRANRAELGGGLCAVSSVIALRNSQLESNLAASGGGAYAYSSVLRTQHARVLANSASGDGGGIAAFESSTLEIGDGTQLDRNGAAGAGGALRLERSTIIAERASLLSNTAASGGAVSISSAPARCPSLFRRTTFMHRSRRGFAVTSIASSSPSSSSLKAEGGAYCVRGRGRGRARSPSTPRKRRRPCSNRRHTLRLSSSDLLANSAAVNGGGIMVVLGVLVSENDTYSNNSAAAGGAAFFLSSEAVLHLTRASDNRASSSGGALEVSNSQLELLRSTLSDNNVRWRGGLVLRGRSNWTSPSSSSLTAPPTARVTYRTPASSHDVHRWLERRVDVGRRPLHSIGGAPSSPTSRPLP